MGLLSFKYYRDYNNANNSNNIYKKVSFYVLKWVKGMV